MSEDQSVPLMQRRSKLLWPVGVTSEFSNPKVRQRAKIAEIRAALVAAGFVALDEQAVTLGLSRSTAWTILNANHKSSGLSARTISRILRSSQLPGPARQRMFEYIQEKIEGLYGHTENRRREFADCLMAALRYEFKLTVEGQENDRRRRLTRRQQVRPIPVSEVKSRRRKRHRSSLGLPRQSV
jgi:hypothetical protein